METLNPRVRLVWAVSSVVVAVLLGVGAAVADRFALGVGVWVAVGVAALAFALGVGYVALKYRVWRFEVRDDDLYLERGVLTRVKTVVPFVRVQHVDTQRGPVERAVGLASVVVYTAGSRGADVTIPGLTPERADALQERLRRLAIESESEHDAV
ncbi:MULTISPECIES: PH domain-containing protein [Halorussus]|uniref:PH domain-containing protein n=1 Tax=Halorussus TaxID=1070314 RepID=UPI0020A0C4BC|nr:PH domain-containing protein [Halorussus vallis]USZ75940.1 PH domain-containing protein [Halorussus vallis]